LRSLSDVPLEVPLDAAGVAAADESAAAADGFDVVLLSILAICSGVIPILLPAVEDMLVKYHTPPATTTTATSTPITIFVDILVEY
jgi:hypothetical protein